MHRAEGAEDLHGGRCQRDFPNAAEGTQAQFHADDKQQQQHTELGQQCDILFVANKAEHRRAEHDTGCHVADDGRLPQARHGEAAQQRDQRDQGE